MPPIAFQDQIPDNNCYGCGPGNREGLRIKSFWDGEAAVCTYRPEHHHSAGPPQFLNGGIIATLIDCHSVCTAIANAYRLGKPPRRLRPPHLVRHGQPERDLPPPDPARRPGEAARPDHRGRPQENPGAVQPLFEVG